MTDLTALDELIKAVEAGEPSAVVVWGNAIGADKLYLGAEAANGSLDAAKALHDALLPGWVFLLDESQCEIRPSWDSDGNEFETECKGTPARAWLLAILRAYRAQIGGAA